MKTLFVVFLSFFAVAQAVTMVDLFRAEWDEFKVHLKAKGNKKKVRACQLHLRPPEYFDIHRNISTNKQQFTYPFVCTGCFANYGIGEENVEHSKKYDNEIEDQFRMKIFMENKHKIAVHNRNFGTGAVSYKLKLNKYADMLHHEFIGVLNGFNKTKNLLRSDRKPIGAIFLAPANVQLPSTVDWRKDGAVTPVKDQGHCGSCWAFSTTGALEAQHFRRDGVLISLSEQNLIDCSGMYGNNGCEGGMMDNAFQYIKANKGIDTEKSYHYEAEDGKCRYNPLDKGAIDVGFADIPEGDEEKLKAAVATVGPISIAIDASHQSFQFYAEGVYDEKDCSSTELDHGVLVVGYGTDDNGCDYWLVKNSWGETWGDKGYIKMARNKNNQCGIASSASYPLV